MRRHTVIQKNRYRVPLSVLVFFAFICASYVMPPVTILETRATHHSTLVTALYGSGARTASYASVTGYYGLRNDGKPLVDRHGIMLVFDGAIKPETVSVDTFEVSLNDGSFAEIVESQVNGAFVFLKLADELASDATPIVGIAEGAEVEDLAGNSTNRRKLGFVQVKDGIAPRLMVTLSGGSGRGTGEEGPDRLTKDTIDIHITSDEPLQGAPRVIVVCENISWVETDSSREFERDIDDFIANRSGAFSARPRESSGAAYTCGYDADGDGVDDAFVLTHDIANSRPGEVWEYTWRNRSGSSTSLSDGTLAVVVYASDRSRHERYGDTVSNWAVGTASFGLDTEFEGSGIPDGVRVFPEDGSKTSEARPFILIEFSESRAVALNSVMLNGVEIAAHFWDYDDNRFVYWPESLNYGQYKVEVDALDAAGNASEFQFGFESVERGDFVLELHPGWNAISFPSSPIDTSISAVFTEPSIRAVIGWNDGRWSLAVRRDGTWECNTQYKALTWVPEGYGYWVKSSDPTRQRIALDNFANRNTDGRRRIHPPAEPGWNFVGVVDTGLDQIEDHFGDVLRDSQGTSVLARDYLGGYDTAFTWDAAVGRYEQLLPNDSMTIGDGVWVYYAPTGR